MRYAKSFILLSVLSCASPGFCQQDAPLPTPAPVAAEPDAASAPSDKPAGPMRVGAGVVAGNRISGAAPVYPPYDRIRRIQGSVIMRAIISRDGNIGYVRVLSAPDDLLAASAVNAVKTWRYKPYLLNGQPTEVDTTITVNFVAR